MNSPRDALRSPTWLAFRYRILERDRFECTACGRARGDGATLHVHHIKSMWKHPELWFDPDNVTTLCLECHRGVHNGRQFSYAVRQLSLELYQEYEDHAA